MNARDLDKHLALRTYVGGDDRTTEDKTYFDQIKPEIEGLLRADSPLINVLRWFDLLQHTVYEKCVELQLDVPVQTTVKEANKAKTSKSKQKKKAAAPSLGDYFKADIRIGEVKEVQVHPSREDMYVQQIDLKEGHLRQIVSGIAAFIDPSNLQGTLVVVLSNVKPADIHGVESHGIVLCASLDDKSRLEVLRPCAGSRAGDRVVVDGCAVSDPDSNFNAKKLHKLKKKLSLDKDGTVIYEGAALQTSEGPIAVPFFENARVG